MNKKRDHRPGDIILDRYLPDLPAEAREEARARLYRFVAWQLRIIAGQVRRELDDSRESEGRATLDSHT